MVLAIVKAAREYIKLDADDQKHMAAVTANQERKQKLVQQWGDALTATIAEIKAKAAV